MGPPLKPGEEQIVRRARGGDARAYEDLVRAHQQVAFRTACMYSPTTADAEEAAQEAFVKAWRALGRFRPGAPFRPWLLAIVANEARTRARAAGRRAAWVERAAALEPREPVTATPEDAVLESARRAALLGALATLSERDREVLWLRFVLDLPEAEMAAVLGCRPGTVKSRLSRALERMREEVTAAP